MQGCSNFLKQKPLRFGRYILESPLGTERLKKKNLPSTYFFLSEAVWCLTSTAYVTTCKIIYEFLKGSVTQ